MKKIKSVILKFRELEPKFADRITAISERPEIKKLDEKIAVLQRQLKEILQKLNTCYVGVGAPSPQHNVESDARALLNGASLDTLPGESVDGQRTTLARQKEALEKAVGILQVEQRHIERKVIRTACEEIRPLVLKYIGAVISSFEAAQTALNNLDLFCWFLEMKGYHQNRRPDSWRLWDFEKLILTGGQFGNLTSLELYLDGRKKVLEQDTGKKTKVG